MPSGADFVAGVYPMMLDETCLFLAMDFDKANWLQDTQSVLETCKRLQVPAYLERSRSGNGGHVWLFFKNAIPAALARRLGSHILTEAMERQPQIGLDSYDRFFPNQDTLPRGGFGNLIALPLQKRPRAAGNSVFVDETGHPHVDQWAFLSSIERLRIQQVERIVQDAGKRGRVMNVRVASEDDEAKPWTLAPSRSGGSKTIAGPLPKEISLTLSDQIYIRKDSVPSALQNRLIRLAAFQNPEFYRAQSMRLPTYDKPRVVSCAEDCGDYLGLPRGCLEDVQSLLSELEVGFVIEDSRFEGSPLQVAFHGVLRQAQRAAVNELMKHDTGVLSATTAFGKTVVAAWMIASRSVNTLILVHRKQLMEQWIDRLSTFLNLAPADIGRIGGGRKRPNGRIDVAVIQSLVRKGVVHNCVADYGYLVVDECHHLSARSFELVARRAKSRYVTGLSATVARKDGHHPIVFMQCGPVRHSIDEKSAAIARPFRHRVVVRPTSFRPVSEADPNKRTQFQDLYRELILDEERNELICHEVVNCVRDGRSPIVLTERKEHLYTLAEMLEDRVANLVRLHGGTARKESRAVQERLAEIPADAERVLLATGRFVGEGFDDPRLDTLFLTLPVSWRGTIAQYAGRLHRRYDGKSEVRIYDYADLNIPMLARMFDRRCEGYEAVGYHVQLPGSAVPGWPAEVALPVDPQWKNDYAASVRRLVRDGVDKPLAQLFVHAARNVPPAAKGIHRARSASEAFLFRRLETLTATKGRFRLNAELPIVFDGWGKMEVDFLYREIRLVIELDGGQHFVNEDAYRRDRRKDLLLQEHGYFVLRFLVQDVGAKLDDVLDRILRTMVHLNRCQVESLT
jgi:superfamily II DNA or RNA helicase/very-short-patch-repair endonuclease